MISIQFITHLLSDLGKYCFGNYLYFVKLCVLYLCRFKLWKRSRFMPLTKSNSEFWYFAMWLLSHSTVSTIQHKHVHGQTILLGNDTIQTISSCVPLQRTRYKFLKMIFWIRNMTCGNSLFLVHFNIVERFCIPRFLQLDGEQRFLIDFALFSHSTVSTKARIEAAETYEEEFTNSDLGSGNIRRDMEQMQFSNFTEWCQTKIAAELQT